MLSRRMIFAAIACLATFGAADAAEKAYSANAFAAAQKTGKGIIVHVYAPWCPTCKAQEPILQKIEADPKFKDVAAFRVDFDKQKEASKAMRATNQSTIIVFKGATEVGRSVGVTDASSIEALAAMAL